MYTVNDIGMVRETGPELLAKYNAALVDTARLLVEGAISHREFVSLVECCTNEVKVGLGLRIYSARYSDAEGWEYAPGRRVDFPAVRKQGAKALELLQSLE